MKFIPLLKKELKGYFISPIAYVVLITFGLISGYIFYALCASFNLISMRISTYPYYGYKINPTEMIATPFFHNMAITSLFMLPLLTMRLFSEEKRSDTIELLFTYPLRDIDILLGKFFASLLIYIFMIGISVIHFSMLELWADLEKKVLLNAYLGLVLQGGAFISVGIFISSLTENQIIAATITFGLLLLFWLLSWLSDIVGEKYRELFSYISFFKHYGNFPEGILDTRDVVYYLSFIVFFQFLTLRILSSKKYRG